MLWEYYFLELAFNSNFHLYLFYLHNKVMNDEAARARRIGSKVCNLSPEYFAKERVGEGGFILNMQSLLKPEFLRSSSWSSMSVRMKAEQEAAWQMWRRD